MSVPLDHQLAVIVEAVRKSGAPPPFSGTPQEARERLRCAVMAARARSSLVGVGSTEDCLAEHAGARVPVRVYRPVGGASTMPTVVFFHGGGFVLGSVELMDDIARKLCHDVHAVIVSVDYRLSPEHPFPAAHDDALTATLWAIRNVKTLGGDASRVAVAGESAGGNLAVSTAITLRDRGEKALAAQLLVVPGVDVARDTLSIEAYRSDFPMLTASDLRDITRLYMGERIGQAAAFPPSPASVRNLAGLPPTVMAVAGHDPLYEEGRAFAARLVQAGVPVQLHCFEDMFHPFLGFFEASESARNANDQLCSAFAECIRMHPLSVDAVGNTKI